MRHTQALLFLLLSFSIYGQSFILEGYTYEVGNRGYLSQVDLEIKDSETNQVLGSIRSDINGHFSIEIPPTKKVIIDATKKAFNLHSLAYNLEEVKDKIFIKVEMTRSPGYLFEITIADKKDSINQIVDAVLGATIEVYNNTTDKEELVLKDYPDPEFKFNMEKGNHYTILIRKKGYRSKQMEAYVNVRDCILCFEGIDKVMPGVTENLTSGNQYGSLLANVGMEKIFSGLTLAIDDLYYDLNKWDIKPAAKIELDKVITLLKYNPNLTIELGSHTDARGRDEYNLTLSEKRAKSAVKYISNKGYIPSARIIANGYGETNLKNDCYNDVDCSEEKHALNRRTEIKVIGIDDVWVFKPLSNIKREEKMEREILSGNSQTITAEELKAILAKEKEEAKKQGKSQNSRETNTQKEEEKEAQEDLK